jgi:hypothetical protein
VIAARVQRNENGDPDPNYFHNLDQALITVVRKSADRVPTSDEDHIIDPEIAWVPIAITGLARAAKYVNGHRLDKTRLFLPAQEPIHRQLYRDMRAQQSAN